MAKYTVSQPRARVLLVALAIVWTVAPACRTAAAEDLALRVIESAWTDGIRDKSFVHRYDVYAPPAPLYLWTRIAGSHAALAVLREQGRLPIYHQWFRYDVGEFDPINTVMADQASPAIPVTRNLDATTLAPLGREVQTNGSFDWRTWSMEPIVAPGRWKVRVVDNWDIPLRCGDHECEFKIYVQ